MNDYTEYLESKLVTAPAVGFEVAESQLNLKLLAWQRKIVRWALLRGCAALFPDTGTGKTFMQLEWGHQVHMATAGDVLLLAPLAVGPQTVREAAKFGVGTPVKICRDQSEVEPGITVANYEMLEHFDPSRFIAVILDESGILKSYSGTTKKAILAAFKATRYKLACTATPAPNDHMEIGNHAEFLNVMSSSEMLSRWFINDTMKAGGYRLKGHAIKDFYRWMATWAVSLSKPSDIGFPDDGFVLPKLHMVYHVVAVDTTVATEGMLFRSPDLSATGLHAEMRLTASARAAKVAEIVATKPDEQWLIWCNTDYEADELGAQVPGVVSVRGSDSIEWKVACVEWFTQSSCLCTTGKFRDKLATWKRKLTGKDTTGSTERSASPSPLNIKSGTGSSAESTLETGLRLTPKKYASPGNPDKLRLTPKTENATPPIQTARKKQEIKRQNGKETTLRNDLPIDFPPSASASNSIAKCSIPKTENALYAELLPDQHPQTGYSSITVIPPGELEGCCVDLAISESGNSKTTSEFSKERSCICGANSGSRYLLSKPSMFGMGLNLQSCHNVVFVGLSYSYEQFYQAIRRCWRYGQTSEVFAHIVHAETEGPVLATIQRKQKDHEFMKAEMISAMREQTMEELGVARRLKWDFERDKRKGAKWEAWLGDSVELMREIPDNEIRFSIFSPPFSNLYIYSDSIRDMGNTASDHEFFKAFGFIAKELHRATLPGRVVAIHCKDLPTYRGRDGASGLKDFPGDIIRLFEEFGWDFHSRVTIWKCPVTERERTNNNGLLHKTVTRDSSQLRMGMADYLIVMRKTPQGDSNLSDAPIARAAGFQVYQGDSDPRKDSFHPSPYARTEFDGKRDSIAIWRRYAEPVWWDIDQTDVLRNFKSGTGETEERHICPLQIGVIKRAIEIWSLPGELVFSPFGGIGSEGVGAIEMGRSALLIELKKQYWEIACRNLTAAEQSHQPGLFG